MPKKNRYKKADAHRPPKKPRRPRKLKPTKDHVVISAWKDAMKNGTFLTPKHDEAYLATPKLKWLKTDRSILSSEAKKNWSPFLDSNEFDIIHYDQPYRTAPGSGYFTVTPHNTKYFSVAGSGILPMDTKPSHPLDTFVVVWGSKQGWHIYTESSTKIAALTASGHLVSGKRL